MDFKSDELYCPLTSLSFIFFFCFLSLFFFVCRQHCFIPFHKKYLFLEQLPVEYVLSIGNDYPIFQVELKATKTKRSDEKQVSQPVY